MSNLKSKLLEGFRFFNFNFNLNLCFSIRVGFNLNSTWTDAKAVPSGRARPARKALIPQPVAENESDMKKKLLAMADVTWLKYTSFEFTKQLSAGSSGQVYKVKFSSWIQVENIGIL